MSVISSEADCLLPCPCRVAKELRTIEDIMQYEQELASDQQSKIEAAEATAENAADSASGDGCADITELESQIEQGFGANQADDLELCSTTELLDMFDDYYQEDKKRLENDFLISQTGTHLDIDFDHPALSNLARSSAAAPVRAQVGSGNAACDVESLISAE